MNNPKASGLAAVHIKPNGATKVAAPEPTPPAYVGWDPYEVWRTRVLEQRREPRPAAETRVDANAKPFLVRTS